MRRRRSDQSRTPSDDVTVVYLRGMPVALVREAKAEAARRGKTLTAIVAEGLTLTLQGSPTKTRRGSDELRGDVAWYERNRARLLERYPGEYVAIVDGAVVDHDPHFERVARRVFERFGSRSVFMPRVMEGDDDRVVQVRSPRLRPKKKPLRARGEEGRSLRSRSTT